jgi:DNA (cytosine-5)-methyltransferase 1
MSIWDCTACSGDDDECACQAAYKPLFASRPVLLDLFCKAGGAAMGYHRAGFDIVGVDIEPQPNYPFTFVQGDATAMGLINELVWSHEVVAVHASPPCQAYIRGGLAATDGRHPRLVEPTRERLKATGLPYVIENVPGAPLRADLVLCGSMFDLSVRRHRWFETNPRLEPWTPPCDHSRPVAGVYGHLHGEAGAWPGMLPSTLASWSDAMGIDWMTADELADAIPPAYTEFIGERLLAVIGQGAAA